MNEEGLNFGVTEHPPLMTVEESRSIRGQLESAEGHIKNLFLRNKKGKMWLLTVHEDRKIDLKATAVQLGAGRFSFCSPERLMTYLGVKPGAVTPLAMLNDVGHQVTFYLGEELFQTDVIHPHPLVNTATVTMQRNDLVGLLESHGHAVNTLPISEEG